MTHIEQRNDTAANWAFVNPVLRDGEMGWESDTLMGKLGDGVTPWNLLDYTKADVDITKADIGLDQVNNTADIDKPISTATQVALNTKAPLASPALTGNPTAPTPATTDNDTSLATTEFVKAVLLAAHPVGDMKVTLNPANPSTYIGGTWVQIGQGKTLIGVDTTDTRFDTAGKEGGSDKITDAHLPDHTHAIGGSTGNDAQDHTHPQFVTANTGGTGVRKDYVADASGLGAYAQGINTGGASNRHTHPLPAATGSKTALTNSGFRSPYVAVYFWKRTA